MSDQNLIIADYREVPSKIPDLLEDQGLVVVRKQLKTGDYIINSNIIIERKTKDDFVVSLLQGRLFSQCLRMKKSTCYPLMLLEGDPYASCHDIDPMAIKGALLSVTVSWRIPVLYSTDYQDSARILLLAANQVVRDSPYFHRTGIRPKKTKNKAIFFLNGLPGIGPTLANSLLKKFGSIEKVILATGEELMETEGLGRIKAKRIREFLSNSF